MKFLVQGVAFSIGLVLAATACAQTLPFLDENSLDSIQLLPPPPSEQSQETKAELETILWLQNRRTPDDVTRIKADAKLSVATFAGVLGPWCTPENLPRMEQMLQKLEQESRFFGERARNHFARKRPRFLDDRIKPALEWVDEPCYPSGNATRGMLCAIVLAELAPQQRAALLERGREIGWNRVVAGVHYPSDVAAGRALGVALARAVLASPKFQEEFSKVKEEFEAVRKKQPVSTAPSN